MDFKIIFDRRSYTCSYQEKGEPKFQLAVLRVALIHEDMLVLEAATARTIHRGMVLRLTFLASPIKTKSVKRSGEGIRCNFLLSDVVHILVAQSPKRLPSSAGNQTTADTENTIKQLTELLDDIVSKELIRDSEEARLREIQAVKEEQARIISRQRKIAMARRIELEPTFIKKFPVLINALIDSDKLSSEMKEHLIAVWELLEIPLVPMTSDDFLKKHKLWMSQTELNVLTLAGAPGIMIKDVIMEDNTRYIPQAELRTFALNTQRMASGSKTFFVFKSARFPQPRVGIFKRKLTVEGDIMEAHILPVEGRVFDWFEYLSSTILVKAGTETLKNFKSATVAGTAYMLLQEVQRLS